ncbi:MAG: carbohydrate kinase family protein [Micrococcales bacterium]|nr:carbohydrate kinase family protein [Micrococcales bacterium]
MTLTPLEQQIVEHLRRDPLLDAAALADLVGSTRASVAVHLSNLTRKGVLLGRGYLLRAEQSAVVVGGAVMDIKGHSAAPAVLHTSNPGQTNTAPGGVGRNIAENIARLGSAVELVAPLALDPMGEQVRAVTAAAGVGVRHLLPTASATGTYLAVLDDLGELVVGIADMRATDTLAPGDLDAVASVITGADLVVAEGNLPAEVIGRVLDLAAERAVPVVVEPVSVAKAARLSPALSTERPVLAITPNVDELAALVGLDGSGALADEAAVVAAARALHDRGIEHVWVRRGTSGSLLASRDGSAVCIAAPRVDALDVTGAGDSMTGAFVHALLRGDSPVRAAVFGQAAAGLTVQSSETVRPDITEGAVDALSADIQTTQLSTAATQSTR